jgi:hypothetical protein
MSLAQQLLGRLTTPSQGAIRLEMQLKVQDSPALGLRAGALARSCYRGSQREKEVVRLALTLRFVDFFAQPRPARPTSQPGAARTQCFFATGDDSHVTVHEYVEEIAVFDTDGAATAAPTGP